MHTRAALRVEIASTCASSETERPASRAVYEGSRLEREETREEDEVEDGLFLRIGAHVSQRMCMSNELGRCGWARGTCERAGLMGAKRRGRVRARHRHHLTSAGEFRRGINGASRGWGYFAWLSLRGGLVRAGHRARTGRRGHERRDGRLIHLCGCELFTGFSYRN